jgi:histidinol dehydrogenase
VGIYVPGGRACYPSSVLMNAIPAQVAGVDEIAMVVPPAADGSVNPYTLAAAAEAGVDRDLQGRGRPGRRRARLRHREMSTRVDKIVGPGNAYVTAAKKLVMGDVGIDMLAGPSEVCVLADTPPSPRSSPSISWRRPSTTRARRPTWSPSTPSCPMTSRRRSDLLDGAPRADIIKRSLADNGLVVVCPDIVAALDAVDLIAPEHLEIQMAEAFDILGSISNAGAIFLGHWTPESIGDYVAGPNHVLPTGGTARFSSPLSVDDFVKKSSVISYSFEALELDGPTAILIAEAEGLDAHARAVSLRLQAMTEPLEDE